MEKVILLVCAHKADENIRNGGVYKAIQVGKSLHPELDLGYLNDNIGDNVSDRNPYWCEYTALYWGWKNIKDTKYIGLCHYRRYFDLEITNENIEGFFQNADIIVIKQDCPMNSKQERLTNLAKVTSTEDAYLFLDTLIYMYPQYKQTILDYYFNSRISYPYSMFIASKEIYDKYCEFIFPVFFQMEQIMKQSGYSRQKRAMGYFGEYSLGLFVLCYHLRAKQVPLDGLGGAIAHKKSWLSKSKIMVKWGLWWLLDSMERKKTELVIPDAVKVGFKQDGILIHSK